MRDKESRKTGYIEIYNVHVKDEKLDCEDDIYTFLNRRIELKIKTKLKNIEEERFAFIIILWCKVQSKMKRFEKFFLSYENSYPQRHLCSINQYVDDLNKKYYFKFEKISEIQKRPYLNPVNESENALPKTDLTMMPEIKPSVF